MLCNKSQRIRIIKTPLKEISFENIQEGRLFKINKDQMPRKFIGNRKEYRIEGYRIFKKQYTSYTLSEFLKFFDAFCEFKENIFTFS
jgi:hypothetical protein